MTLENSPKPPWIVLPEIAPEDLAAYLKQGVSEAWFDQVWRPFWQPLSDVEREQYLRFWKASDAWRQAIGFHLTEAPDLDLEQDARESEEYLAALKKQRGK